MYGDSGVSQEKSVVKIIIVSIIFYLLLLSFPAIGQDYNINEFFNVNRIFRKNEPFKINEDLKIEKNKLVLLEPAFVKRVYDGDTFLTASGRKIRLIGIDCPEMNYEEDDPEYYAHRALQFTIDRLKNRPVYLEYDLEYKDQYGRQLAYVYLYDGTFFNALLLKQGYAHLLTVPPNIRYRDIYQRLAWKAREERQGIWTFWDKIGNKKQISWENAHNYIGKEVIVSGKVVDTYDSGEVVFINFDKQYGETLSLVIFSHELKKFDYKPAEYLLNKEIVVSGIIEEYKGVPEIVIVDPLQIYPVGKL